MQLTVDKDGRVNKAEFIKGHPLLAGASIKAVRLWEFEPSGEQYALEVKVIFELTSTCNVTETFVSAELPMTVRVRTGLGCVTTSSP